MFNLEVPGSVATNTAGKCPDIVLKKSHLQILEHGQNSRL